MTLTPRDPDSVAGPELGPIERTPLRVQVAQRLDFQINHAVARHLIQHVLKKVQPRLEIRGTGTIKVHRHFDLSFKGIAFYAGLTFSHVHLQLRARCSGWQHLKARIIRPRVNSGNPLLLARLDALPE